MTVEVEIHESGEGEPEERTGEDEPQDEVVGFAEADGVVDFARPGVKAVLWWAGGCNHLDVVEVQTSIEMVDCRESGKTDEADEAGCTEWMLCCSCLSATILPSYITPFNSTHSF